MLGVETVEDYRDFRGGQTDCLALPNARAFMGVRRGCSLNDFRGLSSASVCSSVGLFDMGSPGKSMSPSPVCTHCLLVVEGVVSQAPCPGLLFLCLSCLYKFSGTVS